MTSLSSRQEISSLINSINDSEGIYRLFSLLKFPPPLLLDQSYVREINEFGFKKPEIEKIAKLHTVMAFDSHLHVFLIEVKSLTHDLIKYLAKKFYDSGYLRFLLVISHQYKQFVFVIPSVERAETGKHKFKITKLSFEKENLYASDLAVLSELEYSKSDTWREVWKRWRNALSVEKVTELFFEDYKEIFFAIRNSIIDQKIPEKESHEYTLQLLNRIMFLYFISKKKWLDGNPNFIKWFWMCYLKERQSNANLNKFYSNWLSVLFFEVFNNRFEGIKKLPPKIQEAVITFPFLNGGLFKKNDIDKLPIVLGDKLFKTIFEFFEKYNFTIREDLIDSEVAVDPQMIGYVYESLANVAEEIYEKEKDLRGKWGIFYTPKGEVEFMAKRALIEYLLKELEQVPKEKLYHLVFNEEADAYFSKNGLWRRLKLTLDNISIIDPACGSGAF